MSDDLGKYDVLDSRVVSGITEHPKTFSEIYFGTDGVYDECLRLAETSSARVKEPARVLDRRLQALRKKGLIVFKKGWRTPLGQ